MKWIWVDENILSLSQLKKIQETVNQFRVPTDLGQVPCKINSREGFSNFTADQWKNFFTIYTTVSLWNYLSRNDQKILSHFVRVCKILVSQILEINLIEEAYRRLIKIIKLIEENYGRNKITPNLHLSLHLGNIRMILVLYMRSGAFPLNVWTEYLVRYKINIFQ